MSETDTIRQLLILIDSFLSLGQLFSYITDLTAPTLLEESSTELMITPLFPTELLYMKSAKLITDDFIFTIELKSTDLLLNSDKMNKQCTVHVKKGQKD